MSEFWEHGKWLTNSHNPGDWICVLFRCWKPPRVLRTSPFLQHQGDDRNGITQRKWKQ
jgi:hypothetical protein